MILLRTRILAAGVLLAVLLGITGCGPAAKNAKAGERQIWYLNSGEDGLEHAPYEGAQEEDMAGGGLIDPGLITEELIGDLLEKIQTVPEKSDYRPLLDEGVRILSKSLDGNILTLNFSKEYNNMSATREVLTRAGIVRTFAQLEDISGVRFEIEGHNAVSPTGVLLGIMNADSFVEDAGKQINAIQHVAINLYFTGEAGTSLRQEARSIYYTASKPLEWAVVERIIAGPKVEGNYPTVPGNTQIISVSSANGICYVNLNQTFLANALNIDERIPVYSIVNSLVNNCRDIQQVQISVEGESSLIFKQSMDLSHPYEADYTLVETPPTEA